MKTYWAGFYRGKIIQDGFLIPAGYNDFGRQITHFQHGIKLFERKKDAKFYYYDVRKVKITEVK